MKIVLIIYGISWLILLVTYLCSVVNKKKSKYKNPFKSKDPWYLYLIMVLFAPLVLIAIPSILITDKKKEKAQQKRKAEWEEQKREMELKQKEAENDFKMNSTPLKDYDTLIECVLKGKDIIELAESRRYSEMFKKFDAISLSKGLSLQVQKCKEVWPGDRSRLYILNLNDIGERIYDYDIYKHLKVENTYEGAWQVYLLYTLYHYLPLFQHDCYNSRTAVFDKNDFLNIKPENNLVDISKVHVNENNNFYPIISKGKDKYYISACYWSDWGGLIRELIEITIRDNHVESVLDASRDVEFEYDCGIMF